MSATRPAWDRFAGLADLGYEILSTGGTSRFLKEQGLNVIDVSTYTGFPEIMDGRVKTLHPKVHGAILGRPDLPGDAAAIREHGIVPFDSSSAICTRSSRRSLSRAIELDEAIEQIDIGGPSMVRSAAKNHAYVAIVTNSGQYDRVLAALQSGALSLEFRRELMQAAFEMTARYDRAIAGYFAERNRGAGVGEQRSRGAEESTSSGSFPAKLSLDFNLRSTLRYGENPHQRAAFYVEPQPPAASLAAAEVLHGKELSYNNLLDLDAALAIVREFSEPAAVVIKHNNPCGCAVASTLAEAFLERLRRRPGQRVRFDPRLQPGARRRHRGTAVRAEPLHRVDHRPGLRTGCVRAADDQAQVEE